MTPADSSGRSSGWKAARRTGARAESSAVRILRDKASSGDARYFGRFGLSGPVLPVTVRGTARKQVPAVGGGHTPPKADVEVCASEVSLGVSVKSSATGQVGLHAAESFVAGLEHHSGYQASEDTLRELRIFAGSDVARDEILEVQAGRPAFAPRSIAGRLRVSPEDRRMYAPEAFEDLVDWLSFGIVEIGDLVFSRGVSAEGHAAAIWYLVGRPERADQIDTVLLVEDILAALARWRDAGCMVAPGPSGSTFDLPFGSLQAHQGRLQFQHSLEKLRRLGVPER